MRHNLSNQSGIIESIINAHVINTPPPPSNTTYMLVLQYNPLSMCTRSRIN